MIEAERTVASKTSTEHRYYISSGKSNLCPISALQAARKHWESRTDCTGCSMSCSARNDCRVRAGNAAERLRVMRHLS